MSGTSTVKSRSLGALYFVIVLALLSAVTPSSWLGIKPKKPAYTKINLGGITSQSTKIKDLNHDGVISWSEVVSSSLDGSTSTLAKIKSEPIDQKAIDQLNDPNNLTGSFSKNIFLATAQLREKGATDIKTKQRTLTYLMGEEAKKITVKTYLLSDLQIADTETKDSIRTYGNTIAPLVKTILSKEVIVSDITSLAKFTQSQNESDLTPLANNKARVDALIKKLLLVKVPPSATTYHLLVINRLSTYRDILGALSNINNDPLKGNLMFSSYQKSLEVLVKIPTRLSEYFTDQNVIFTNKEAGYMFTVGYTYK